MKLVYEIWLEAGLRTDVCAAASLHLKKNDLVVANFGQYEDFGRVLQCRGEIPAGADPASLPDVLRLADIRDQSRAHENHIYANSVRRKVTEIVGKAKLGMKVHDTHLSFDRKKATIRFTSPGRVDFRDLVRELARQLNMKVELRQIGVRDVAKMNGGLGTCGRPLCCSSWMHEFVSLNIKMARDQQLPLNTGILSGQCGRLKCCLSFEHAGYMMMAQTLPLPGSRIQVQGGEIRVLDVNLLRQSALVRVKQDGRVLTMSRAELENSDLGASSCSTGSCSTGSGNDHSPSSCGTGACATGGGCG